MDETVLTREKRTKIGKLASYLGILINVILCGFKLAIGFIVNSISIIGDAINNMADFASSSVTLVGFHIANKPADKKHPFGHERIEYIAGLIVSVIILALAVLLFSESIQKIINKKEANYDIFAFVILSVAIVFKIGQAVMNFVFAKKIKSVTLKATAVDSLTDCVATSVLLVSSLLSAYVPAISKLNLDGYVGIAMAIFILVSGIKMLKETSSPLIGEVTSRETIKKITDAILEFKGVLGIHDVVAHNYGPTKTFMTVHVEVDARTNILKSHELLDDIEMKINKQYNVELTCHMDPIDISNPETIALKKETEAILNKLNVDNEMLSMHDFRVVHGKKHTNVLFDVVVPFSSQYSKNFSLITETFIRELNHNKNKQINVIIHYDRPFTE